MFNRKSGKGVISVSRSGPATVSVSCLHGTTNGISENVTGDIPGKAQVSDELEPGELPD